MHKLIMTSTDDPKNFSPFYNFLMSTFERFAFNVEFKLCIY